MVVLAPIAPASSGNGLAMRVRQQVVAALAGHDVHLVVIPVAGEPPLGTSVPAGVVSAHWLPLVADPAGVVAAWLGDPLWRGRFGRIAPLPAAGTFCPPQDGERVLHRLSSVRVGAVLALRLSTALAGLAVAERTGAPLIIDADDDDAVVLAQVGREREAAAWDRLASTCLPAAALVTAAGAPQAASIAARHKLERPVAVVPNGVPIPPLDAIGPPPGDGRVVFVGNLTYEPNIDAARWLTEAVLPYLPARASLHLVGPAAPVVQAMAGPRIRVAVAVVDLMAEYASADVAVAPLRAGSGTRIKILEAMAIGRPVVATSLACEGLPVTSGVHVEVADSPEVFARRIEALGEPGRAAAVIGAARALAHSYDAARVVDATARMFNAVTK